MVRYISMERRTLLGIATVALVAGAAVHTCRDSGEGPDSQSASRPKTPTEPYLPAPRPELDSSGEEDLPEEGLSFADESTSSDYAPMPSGEALRVLSLIHDDCVAQYERERWDESRVINERVERACPKTAEVIRYSNCSRAFDYELDGWGEHSVDPASLLERRCGPAPEDLFAVYRECRVRILSEVFDPPDELSREEWLTACRESSAADDGTSIEELSLELSREEWLTACKESSAADDGTSIEELSLKSLPYLVGELNDARAALRESEEVQTLAQLDAYQFSLNRVRQLEGEVTPERLWEEMGFEPTENDAQALRLYLRDLGPNFQKLMDDWNAGRDTDIKVSKAATLTNRIDYLFVR